jgi:hypothetical protein
MLLADQLEADDIPAMVRIGSEHPCHRDPEKDYGGTDVEHQTPPLRDHDAHQIDPNVCQKHRSTVRVKLGQASHAGQNRASSHGENDRRSDHPKHAALDTADEDRNNREDQGEELHDITFDRSVMG